MTNNHVCSNLINIWRWCFCCGVFVWICDLFCGSSECNKTDDVDVNVGDDADSPWSYLFLSYFFSSHFPMEWWILCVDFIIKWHRIPNLMNGILRTRTQRTISSKLDVVIAVDKNHLTKLIGFYLSIKRLVFNYLLQNFYRIIPFIAIIINRWTLFFLLLPSFSLFFSLTTPFKFYKSAMCM